MKLGITGDTHGSLASMRKILQVSPPVEMWLHAGDHAEDANFFSQATGLPTVCVSGNCDFGSAAKPDEFLELEGSHIWLTHGHKYLRFSEKSDMKYWAGVFGADIAVYGHTHVPMIDSSGILLLNPGSPFRPRGGSRPGFIVLTLKRGQNPSAEFVEL